MNKLDIEGRLDRSLANQIKAPRLDRRFDAGVWARIAAQEQRTAMPVAPGALPTQTASSRWLLISNAIGVSVAVILVIYFGLRAFTGAELDVSVPEVSAATVAQITELAVKTITVAALVLGMVFTPLGRRLRAELS